MLARVVLEARIGGRMVRLASTSNVGAIRAVRDAVLAEFGEQSRSLDGVDPVLQSVKAAETRRLASLLGELFPAEQFPEAPEKPRLEVVRPNGRGPKRGKQTPGDGGGA